MTRQREDGRGRTVRSYPYSYESHRACHRTDRDESKVESETGFGRNSTCTRAARLSRMTIKKWVSGKRRGMCG